MDMMMSQKEAKRGQVMELLSAGKVDQKEAGKMLAVSAPFHTPTRLLSIRLTAIPQACFQPDTGGCHLRLGRISFCGCGRTSLSRYAKHLSQVLPERYRSVNRVSPDDRPHAERTQSWQLTKR